MFAREGRKERGRRWVKPASWPAPNSATVTHHFSIYRLTRGPSSCLSPTALNGESTSSNSERTSKQQHPFPTALWARAQDSQWRGENKQRQQRLPCSSSIERCGLSCSSSLHACSCGPHELALSLSQSQMHACKSKAKSHDKQGPDNSTCMHSPKIAARTQLQLPRAHTRLSKDRAPVGQHVHQQHKSTTDH